MWMPSYLQPIAFLSVVWYQIFTLVKECNDFLLSFGEPDGMAQRVHDAYEREHPLQVHPWNRTLIAIPVTTRITTVQITPGNPQRE